MLVIVALGLTVLVVIGGVAVAAGLGRGTAPPITAASTTTTVTPSSDVRDCIDLATAAFRADYGAYFRTGTNLGTPAYVEFFQRFGSGNDPRALDLTRSISKQLGPPSSRAGEAQTLSRIEPLVSAECPRVFG